MGMRHVPGLWVIVVVLAIAMLNPLAAQTQKGTLIFAVESLSGQTMDPILEARPGNAIYQAPMYDSLVGFDFDKGGTGPGVGTWADEEGGLVVHDCARGGGVP